jgi:hypothetical protein
MEASSGALPALELLAAALASFLGKLVLRANRWGKAHRQREKRGAKCAGLDKESSRLRQLLPH